MSDTKQVLTMLSRVEAQTLQSFISQVDSWQYNYGDKATTVEIIYYPEDDGFEVINGEPNNGVKRNRASLFRTEILSWGANQLRQLQGWDNNQIVRAFAVSYKDGKFGVSVEIADKNLQTESQTNEESESV